MDIETTKSEQPKTISKEKVKRKYPTKAELLRIASSQELIAIPPWKKPQEKEQNPVT